MILVNHPGHRRRSGRLRRLEPLPAKRRALQVKVAVPARAVRPRLTAHQGNGLARSCESGNKDEGVLLSNVKAHKLPQAAVT
jgi:hypothetical protein